MSSPLERFARRMQADAFYLAVPLARYAMSHRLNDEDLAAELGCEVGVLTHLRLCRSPDPMPPYFWNDIERVAGHFHLDAEKLAEVVRFGQALSLPAPPREVVADQQPGYLMAARDDESEPPSEEAPS
jgi:hypothetical protein